MAAKLFEVGDVLPATTQLRIIVDIPEASRAGGSAYTTNEYLWVYVYDDGGNDYSFDVKVNGSILYLDIYPEDYNLSKLVNNEWVSCEYIEYSIMSIIIDTSTWTETQRTIVKSTTQPIYWEDLNAPSGYTITFNSNGGTTFSDIEEATELPTLPTPTKSGYTFVAWYYESNFQTRANAGDTIESNVTLYAKWHNLGTLFTGIANAIRSKDGTSGNIRDLDFDDRISVLPSPKEEETKTVTPNFSSGNQVITPTSGKVLSQVTLTKPTDLIPENIAKDKNVCGVVGTLEGGGGIISLMATSEYYAIKTGTQSSALRWTCSTELFNKPIFIDANGNLYTPAQVGVYFNGTYKTRADTTLYTFGTYSTTMTGRITFKTVSGGITVSLINLDYSEELWGTGVYFYFSAYISWSVSGGTTGVSLQTQWASICFVQKTWLNNFSDITDGYCSDNAVIGSTIIANGGAIARFSIHLEDPD